ncbi:MAG: hypothetical protein MK085_07760 [Phycisphaerales bacterium]|nr:hypothetical protein [Phycisphaerales bacterium]
MSRPERLQGGGTALLLLLTACLACGCAPSFPSGSISINGRSAEPVQLVANFGYGGYAVEEADTELILSTVSLDDLQSGNYEYAQVIHAQLLWSPRAGRTPVNKMATNLVIRHVVLVGDQVGLYGGGGFAWPRGTPGKTGLGLDVTGSSISLLDSTDGFRDLLSPAELRGWIGGPLDPTAFERFRNTISQIVTNRLGRTTWVDARDYAPTLIDVASRSSTSEAGLPGAGHAPG